MSFTITATRRPCLFSNTCFRVVVLPAPRKPDRTLTGSGFDSFMAAAAARTWSSGSAFGGASAGAFGGSDALVG